MEAPADAFELQMHYRSNGIADATWYVTIAIETIPAEEFSTRHTISPQNTLSRDRDYMDWLAWINAHHTELSVRDLRNGIREYRRDIALPDRRVGSLHATYRYEPFSASEQHDDDAAIRRILLSARPLIPAR